MKTPRAESFASAAEPTSPMWPSGSSAWEASGHDHAFHASSCGHPARGFPKGHRRPVSPLSNASGEKSLFGHRLCFFNRSRKALRLLLYDGQGFWLCRKRLSQDRFRPLEGSENVLHLAAHELQILLWNGDMRGAGCAPFWKKITPIYHFPLDAILSVCYTPSCALPKRRHCRRRTAPWSPKSANPSSFPEKNFRLSKPEYVPGLRAHGSHGRCHRGPARRPRR